MEGIEHDMDKNDVMPIRFPPILFDQFLIKYAEFYTHFDWFLPMIY